MVKYTQFIAVGVVVLLWLFPPCYGAAEPEIIAKESSSEFELDPHYHPAFGTYHYDIFWRRVMVGTAKITFSEENGLYQLIVKAETNRKINLFYTFKYRGEVEMEGDPLKPLQAKVSEKSGSRVKDTQIDFINDDKAEAVQTESVRGEVRKIRKRSAESDTFLLDPFSVVFLVRHLDWHVGMAEVFDIFTGRKKYELKLFCDGVKEVAAGEEKRMAWIIRPETRDPLKPGKKPKSEFKLYLSRDEKKEILKIEGAPKVGRVVARITNFVPQDEK